MSKALDSVVLLLPVCILMLALSVASADAAGGPVPDEHYADPARFVVTTDVVNRDADPGRDVPLATVLPDED